MADVLKRVSPAYTFPAIVADGGYVISEDQPVIKSETTSAQGYPVRKFATNGLTKIDVTFSSSAQTTVAAILAALNVEYTQFEYWSPLHGVYRRADFYVTTEPVTLVHSLDGKLYQEFTTHLVQKGLSSDATATTVTKFATAVDDSDGTWADATNIYADDGSYATTAGGNGSYWDLVMSDWDFALPETAVISSITLEMQYKLSTTSSKSTLSMWMAYKGRKRGTGWTSTAEPTSDTVVTTTQNGSWTPAELNSATDCQAYIRVYRQSSTACTYSFDYIKITVVYREVS